MEKKKMKAWKKILIFIAFLLIIYLITVIYKYIVLGKVILSTEKANKAKLLNYYYYSEYDTQIYEHWQKDGIMKTNINRKEEVGSITMWENTNTGEKYMFINEPQNVYQEGGQVVPTILSSHELVDNRARISFALNPTVTVYPKKYDEKNCYQVNYSNYTEIFEKEHGFMVYDKEHEAHYKFNTVTDEDVKMPNLEEYTYLEKNS